MAIVLWKSGAPLYRCGFLWYVCDMRPGGGIQDFHLVLVGYTLRCRGGVSSMRVTPSLVLTLRRLGVTPRDACPLPLLVVSILTFFTISFLFSFPVRSGGLVWVMGIVLWESGASLCRCGFLWYV